MTIGKILQQARKKQHMTQKEVSREICSQAMLSSIEHDKYSPNVELVIALCQRLAISLESLSLAQNYAVSSNSDFNNTLDTLCNAHQYTELLAFLQSHVVLSTIVSSAQTQSYYYYLAVAEFQTSKKTERASEDLKLALAEHKTGTPLSTLDRLCFGSLAFLKNNSDAKKGIASLYQQAFAELETTPYSPNLNILYYLSAFSAYQNLNYTECVHRLLAGIDFIVAHDSHYMLANIYYLLAKAAQKLDNENQKNESEQRSVIFKELFNEKIFRKF
ncbi:helix-turn-helix domain-containing protein [Liquorilactobacillus uvarum]|nr:helix-turn-helix transcriptional regulator [Liquorilactobacillus uvarum]